MAVTTPYYLEIDTKIGVIGLTCDGSAITGIYVGDMDLPCYPLKGNELLHEAASELHEYLDGKRRKFEVPFEQTGSDFQKEVWDGLAAIPYGRTFTYKQLAEYIGHPRAYRAVGTACGQNRLPIIVPCHRVVSSNGLGGFSCGLDTKRKLLSIEGII